MGFLLQIRRSWLRALSTGCRYWCWCCGPGCWCCELAERAFKMDGGDGRVLPPLPVLSAGKAHRRWCLLIVAGCAGCVHSCSSQSHVNRSWDSTGRGILPSYLGLCWCNFSFAADTTTVKIFSRACCSLHFARCFNSMQLVRSSSFRFFVTHDRLFSFEPCVKSRSTFGFRYRVV